MESVIRNAEKIAVAARAQAARDSERLGPRAHVTYVITDGNGNVIHREDELDYLVLTPDENCIGNMIRVPFNDEKRDAVISKIVGPEQVGPRLFRTEITAILK